MHKTVDMSSEKETFDSFFQTLKLECERGEPFYMNWTVPMDAPDLLYYQVKNGSKNISTFKISKRKISVKNQFQYLIYCSRCHLNNMA